ncbi:hypothetical protein GPALN_010967 [Globodera pallida]|nr:hypothetical protein GPALN_010967 [Globodera pallida]
MNTQNSRGLRLTRPESFIIEHRGPNERALTFVGRKAVTYFEAQIIQKTGTICVGYAPRNFNARRVVAWSDGTFGVETDGEMFNDGHFVERIPSFFAGDTIACQLDRTTHTVSYYLNGTRIDYRDQHVPADSALYPAVTLRSPGDKVEIRMGDLPRPSESWS